MDLRVKLLTDGHPSKQNSNPEIVQVRANREPGRVVIRALTGAKWNTVTLAMRRTMGKDFIL